MKIHFFNPENDMALADGSPGYTPPANIRTYRQANWRLPEKWAAPDDIVWDGQTRFHNLGIATNQEFCLAPWGWSPAIVHQLELAGFPRNKMPTAEWLQKLRALSSRETTVSIQRQLGIEAYVCHSIQEITDILTPTSLLEESGMKHYILKSPWSSSGKGLMLPDNPNWQGWTRRILRQQGAVITERKLNRAQDFAMEFMMDTESGCRYCGISLFITDEYGHYQYNIHGTEGDKLALLSARTPTLSINRLKDELHSISTWYLTHLPLIAPWYHGPVGVDMLVSSTGEICPCIEINWRMTMGMASVLQVF